MPKKSVNVQMCYLFCVGRRCAPYYYWVDDGNMSTEKMRIKDSKKMGGSAIQRPRDTKVASTIFNNGRAN